MELRRAVETDDDLLTEVASHLILAGGKRIRPGFCLGRGGAPAATRRPAPGTTP